MILFKTEINEVDLSDAQAEFNRAVDRNDDAALAVWARRWGAALIDKADEAIDSDIWGDDE